MVPGGAEVEEGNSDTTATITHSTTPGFVGIAPTEPPFNESANATPNASSKTFVVIGVLVPALVLLLAVLGFLAKYRWRQNRKITQGHTVIPMVTNPLHQGRTAAVEDKANSSRQVAGHTYLAPQVVHQPARQTVPLISEAGYVVLRGQHKVYLSTGGDYMAPVEQRQYESAQWYELPYDTPAYEVAPTEHSYETPINPPSKAYATYSSKYHVPASFT